MDWGGTLLVLVGALGGACAVGVIGLFGRRQSTNQAAHDQSTSGIVNVTSVNQSGGQTAHTIVNREPTPAPARCLTAEQAAKMERILADGPKGHIVEVQFGSKEHARFSAQIASVFARCGWKRETFCIPGRDEPHGIRVGFNGVRSPAFGAAIEALRAAGLEFEEGEYQGFPADVALDVGLIQMSDFQKAADRWPD